MFGKALKATDERDPNRVLLANAIAARDVAAARLEATRAASSRLADECYEAQRKLSEARAAAAEDQERLVREIVAGGSAAVLERVDGRARQANIEAEIDALQSARALVRSEVADAERGLDFKQRLLRDAVNAVLTTAAPRLTTATAAAKKEFEALAIVCRFLRSSLSSDECRRKLDEAIAFIRRRRARKPHIG